MSGLQIIYDGECPVCRFYVLRLRLRQSVGEVTLVDARAGEAWVRELAQQYDLNQGMLVVYGQQYYYGADAIQLLALLASPVGGFNRVMAWLFASPWRARYGYPLLAAARRLLLRILGRPLLPF